MLTHHNFKKTDRAGIGPALEKLSLFSNYSSTGCNSKNTSGLAIECDSRHIPINEFSLKVQRCINLLKTKAPEYYGWLLKYNLKIRAYSSSGANFTNNSIDIALRTFNASDTWLSSVLVHEAIHFYQSKSGIYQNQKLTEHELEANKYQLGVLQLIGAPDKEILYLQNANGKHWDLTRKGSYSVEDYKLRNY